MEQKNHVVLVDKDDNEIGIEEKLKAHQLGLLHRAFSVFLFRRKNGEIQVLLQKRAKEKYHCGGLWANACCSHPAKGENIIDAGKRRLKEEMGIEVYTLESVGSFTYKAEFANGLTEHEIDHVLIGVFDADVVSFNPNEVEDAKWISLENLEKEMFQHPDRFVPWLKLALAIIPKEAIMEIV